MSEQQVLNYLYWLRDRGQIFAFAPDNANPVIEEPALALPKKLRLLFITAHSLQENEAEMIIRIAAALGVRSEEFSVVLSESAHWFEPEFTVNLGLEIDESTNVLSIPHPSKMLKDPGLKRDAWDKLQKLKAQFTI